MNITQRAVLSVEMGVLPTPTQPHVCLVRCGSWHDGMPSSGGTHNEPNNETKIVARLDPPLHSPQRGQLQAQALRRRRTGPELATQLAHACLELLLPAQGGGGL